MSFAESEASSVADRSLEVGIPKKSPAGSPATSPFKNPTYPPRVHFLERAAILDGLRTCDERLQAIKQKLDLLGNHPQKAAHERVYHQMLGARDQVAETARRLPLETGALYDEDKERYEVALAAFDRVFRQWDNVR